MNQDNSQNIAPQVPVNPMFEKFDRVLGVTTPTTNTPPVQSRADQIREIARQSTTPPPSSQNDFNVGGVKMVGGPVGGIFKDTLSDISNRAQNVANDIMAPAKAAQGGAGAGEVALKVGEAGLRTAGNVAGGVLDVAKNIVSNLTPGPVKQWAADRVADFSKGKMITDSKTIGQHFQEMGTLLQQHPEAAKDVGSVMDILGLLGMKAGGESLSSANIPGKVNDVVGRGVQGTKDFFANRANGKVLQSTWDMVQPTLTKTEQAQAVQQGKIVSQGKLGTITQIPQGRDMQMIDAANPYVSGAKNPIEAVANMQQGIADEATKLKEGLDATGAIYSKSQITGALNKLDPPTMIASDSTLNNAYNLVKQKMLSLVGNGGNLGDLLDARKSFDSFINKQFPNLYNSDTLTPMRSAIKDIRGALNDVIDSRLPDGTLPNGVNFRDSLKTQSLLYDAIDNAASKVPKLGSNAIQKWIKENPIKAKAIGWTFGILGAEKALKGSGVPLP